MRKATSAPTKAKLAANNSAGRAPALIADVMIRLSRAASRGALPAGGTKLTPRARTCPVAWALIDAASATLLRA